MSAGGNNVVSFYRGQLSGAHQVLEGTMADVTPTQAHWTPPGVANPVGANYAHVVLTEDAIVNNTLRGAAPLFASSWAGKVGISEPPPQPNPAAPGLPSWSDWGRRVKIDMGAIREYAQAVYTASDEYLASLSDDELDRPVDLSLLGLGESTVGQILGGVLLGNVQWHCGEISCLKGLQGAKGYPF